MDFLKSIARGNGNGIGTGEKVIQISYGTEIGGVAIEAPPFTGNGFTKATNGQIIPEFKCSSLTKIEDGAQLIEIEKDGTKTIIAIYDIDFGRFVPVD